MEISGDGAVRVFDGPAVVTEAGSAPIGSPATQSGPRRVARRPAAPPWAAIREAAAASGISPDLIAAVAWRESGFQSDARSRVGAEGLMQLMPSTAKDLGVDPRSDGDNLKGGAQYLNRLMRRYKGDLTRVLAAYNAGPAAVDRQGGALQFKETRAYVDAVLNRLSQIAVARTGEVEQWMK
jgi:soluble lytic murein transglycosylase-like protein